MYVIGQPVIQFTKSSLDLFLLADVPDFNKTGEVDKVLAVKNTKKSIKSSEIKYPLAGRQYGKVKIPVLKLDTPLYFGDSPELLRKGSGQYLGSVFPGERGTTLIGGHNTDSFGRLIGVKNGDNIVVQTSYGYYQYQVVSTGVYLKTDKKIKKILNQQTERQLLLYTCYPIDSIGMTDRRLFIQAKLIDGPIVEESK